MSDKDFKTGMMLAHDAETTTDRITRELTEKIAEAKEEGIEIGMGASKLEVWNAALDHAAGVCKENADAAYREGKTDKEWGHNEDRDHILAAKKETEK